MRLTRRETLAGGFAVVAGQSLNIAPLLAQEGPPRRGGTLTVFLESDARSLDPYLGAATVVDRKIYNLYAESLLTQGPNSELQPLLAESWKVEDGGKLITFTLRQGIKFTDGTPFNAEAAKFNLDRLLDPKTGGQLKQYVGALKQVDAVDERTLRVTLSYPSAPFLAMMANEPGAMISPTAFKANPEEFGRNPVGTGPFKVTARATNEVSAVRNENYWRMGADGKPLPYLDAIKMTVNPNSSVRLVQMMSGTAQLCDPVLPKDFDQVTRNPNLNLLNVGTDSAFVLSFNIRRPPFDDISLRKAVVMAIDRAAMARVVTNNTGGALRGIEPPNSWVYDDNLKGSPYDAEQAKALYAKSGHKGPITLSLIQRDPDTQIAEIMQSMLKRAGIELKLDASERLAWIAKVPKGEFEISLSKSLPGQRPDVDIQYRFAYSRNATLNYVGFKNDKIFDMVDKAHGEQDRAARKKLYVDIQREVLENYYQSFLFWGPTKEVASKKLNGIKHDATSIWRYDEMWLSA